MAKQNGNRKGAQAQVNTAVLEAAVNKAIVESSEITNLSELPTSVQNQVTEIQNAGGTAVVYKCKYCGKTLVREASQERGDGDRCEHVQNMGIDWAAHYQAQSVPVPPEGYIKVADAHKRLVELGFTISSFVKAFGGDRNLEPPVDPLFKCVYVGKTRWINGAILTPTGLLFLKPSSGRKPVRKAEKSDPSDIAELLASADTKA